MMVLISYDEQEMKRWSRFLFALTKGLETAALETLYSGQFTLSTHLITEASLFFDEQGSNENIGERFPWLCIGSSSLLLGSGSVDRN